MKATITAPTTPTTTAKDTGIEFPNPSEYRRFAAACSKDTTRATILTPCASQGIIFATDGKRLHGLDFGQSAFGEARFALPAKLTGKVQLGFSEDKAKFFSNGKIESCPPSDYQIPSVRQVIPSPGTSSVTFLAASMLDLLREIKTGTFPEQRAIITPEGLKIRAYWQYGGGRLGNVEFQPLPWGKSNDITGTLPSVMLNPIFLREAVAFIGDHCAFVRVECENEMSPVVLRPAHGGGVPAPLAVIMPLRLNS